MNSRQRRVRAIELTLTPQQVVVVWLRNAMQAGTLEENVRHSPPHRGTVANQVYHTVRNCMKGQPEPLVEQAILQARREADLLYLLVFTANTEVLENSLQRKREYFFLFRYLSAEIRWDLTKDRAEIIRLTILAFIQPVIILDAAIARLVTERLSGQPVLFRDPAAEMAELLQMATDLSSRFNKLAHDIGAAEINLEELRNSLQSEAEQRIAMWVKLARVEMLITFGEMEEVYAALDRCLYPDGRKAGEDNLRAAIGFLSGIIVKALDQRLEERRAHLEQIVKLSMSNTKNRKEKP